MIRIIHLIAAVGLTGVTARAQADDAHTGPVTAIAIGRVDGKIYSCSQGGVFEGTAGQLSLELRPNFRVVALASFRFDDDDDDGDGDGPGLLVAGGDPGVSGSVGWRQHSTFRSHRITKDMVDAIAVAPDQQLMAIACANGDVLVREGAAAPADEGWVQRHQHTATARAVAFSPDGKWLASAGLDGVLILSPTSKTDQEEPLHLDDHSAGIECLTFSPDSSMIASGSRDSKVRIHLVTGKLLRSYDALGMAGEPVAARVPSRVLSIAWGQGLLVAGTSKGTLHSLALGDDSSLTIERRDSEPITALAFNRDRRQLLVGTRTVSTLDSKALGIAE